MANEAGFHGRLPLVVKAAAHTFGRGLEHEFAGGGERSAQAGQGFRGVAGPAGKFRAVEILYCEASAHVTVAGGGHHILSIERWKCEKADVGLRGAQRTGAKRGGKAAHEAMDDAEDGFGGLLRVRDLESEGAGLGDGAQEEARCGPGGQAHLARLENDVLTPAALLEGALNGVGNQRRGEALARADTEQSGDERFSDGASAERDRTAVEDVAEALELIAV